MKKILFTLLTILFSVAAINAVEMKDLKIYINPGHGGYDSDDRPITIYPYSQSDTLGYWESKSNLYKGLHMYWILDSLGAKPYISRIKNRTEDDRSLSGIGNEATNLNCDLFFSIHTNAGETVNYPLMLYRESTVGTPRYPEAIKLSNLLWDNLHSSKVSLWTRNTPYVSGDLTFYPQWGTSGLGVLRNLWLPGVLSEGGMHEHRPEAHRLMNDDFWWLEAWHFVRTIMEFYETTDRFVTGNVAGVVYDNHNTRENTLSLYYYSAYGRDRNKPLNGAYIELQDMSGNVIQKRTTDNENNGVFVFRNVKPGNYKLVSTDSKYYTYEKDVVVTANEVTYNDIPMDLKRETPLVVESYSPNVDSETLVSCVEPLVFKFNHDIDEKSFETALKIVPAIEGEITYSNSFHTATFKPAIAFDLSTDYTITLGTELCTPDPNYSGAHLAEPLVFTFTTKGRNKLELLSTAPVENGEIHYASPTIELRFDKALDGTNLYNLVKVLDKDGNALTVNQRSSSYNKLSNGYGNLSLVLTSNLKVGESYKIVVSPEVKDKEGVPLAEEVTVNFKAIDVTANQVGTLMEGFEDANLFVGDADNSVSMRATPTYFTSTSKRLFDKASGNLVYKFANPKEGVAVWNYGGTMKIVNNGYTIGVYVFGDMNNHELQLGFTAGTDTKYETICKTDFIGWKFFSHKLTTLENNVEYLLSNVRLNQTEALYAQDGSIYMDNLLVLDTSGVEGNFVNDDDIVITPNPADDFVTIKTNDEVTNVDLYNLQGAIVATSTMNVINVKHLPNGSYLIKVTTDKGSIVKKLLISHK